MDFSGLKQRFYDWWIKTDLSFSKNQLIAVIFLVIVVVSISLFLFFRPSQPIEIKQTGGIDAGQEETSAKIVIYVTGQVKKPGVYSLKDGSRIVDAIKAAGSFTSKADTESLNLAQKLTDGEKILVAKKGKLTTGQSGQDGKISLNTATEQQLEELPGIGETLAKRIIDYRQQQGSFKSVDELSQVEGIGPKKFSQIKDKVSVN